MPIDPAPTAAKFALFANGAGLSRQVLTQLRISEKLPACVVVPEYPPARVARDQRSELLDAPAPNEWHELIGELPLWYAPESQQTAAAADLRAAEIDFLLVVCWPYRISDEIVAAVHKAALNLHPSLLPAFRGANPIADQLSSGAARFGVSLHLLEAELDAGDIVAWESFSFETTPTFDEIEARAGQIGTGLFLRAMATHARGWVLRPQSAQEFETD